MIMQMTLSAGILVLAAAALRKVKKFPRGAVAVLWGVALLRFLLPLPIPFAVTVDVDINSIFSRPVHSVTDETHVPETIPRPETQTHPNGIVSEPNTIQQYIPIEATPPVYALSTVTETSPPPIDNNTPSIPQTVWLTGMGMLFVYFGIIYVTTHRKLYKSLLPIHNQAIADWIAVNKPRWRRVTVKCSNQISSPLTVGIIKPNIILPASMDMENKPLLRFILLHELYHIKNMDAVWKILLALAVCVHWLNPLVWVMFFLANRDLEVLCDERVVDSIGLENRKPYAFSLVSMSAQTNQPMAFVNHFKRRNEKNYPKGLCGL